MAKDNWISIENLPFEITGMGITTLNKVQHREETLDLKSHTEKTEKDVILNTLRDVKFNKSKAARLLNIDRKTLYNKIKLYGISLE